MPGELSLKKRLISIVIIAALVPIFTDRDLDTLRRKRLAECCALTHTGKLFRRIDIE